ncbi:hypothetical protein EC973_008136 [Apophysomyces ossiformis]|uniref:Xylanolytic transcriptional activator regulatory domain-containing protein n=1 Tax=Apophysomyces ossiformis TaxID=679940 RepID=A0A8H7BNS6_9FUNG|nr:hypothetical protein EC973_008136 [Apophysomyces ossiformis]
MSAPFNWQQTPSTQPGQPQPRYSQPQPSQYTLRPLQPLPFPPPPFGQQGHYPATIVNSGIEAKRMRIGRACAKKRGPPKGYIEVLENRLKRMERILGGLSEGQDKETPRKKKKKRRQTAISSDSELAEKQDEPRSSLSSTPETKQHSDTGQLSFQNGEATRYFGDNSALPFLAQKINFDDKNVTSQLGFRFRRLGQDLVWYQTGDEDQRRKGGSLWILEHLGKLKPGETIKGMNDWIFRISGIDRATSDRLMKVFNQQLLSHNATYSYFAYIHPGLPVINKTLFLKQYREEVDGYPSPPLLNAMYGAAVRYIETCQSFGDEILDYKWKIPAGWSESFFDNVMIFFQHQRSPSISSVQALVIFQNHRASIDEKVASGWLINATAVRMAQDLGLHRSSESWDVSDCEKETRRRVWWSVYVMDRWFSAAMGRPQTIFDEDCDEAYPKESATWEEVMDLPPGRTPDDEDGPRFPSLEPHVACKVKGEDIPIYQPFVQVVKLSEILGRILQGLYTPKAKKHSAAHGSDALVKYLDNALSEWRSALPPALQISNITARRLDSRGQTPLLSMSVSWGFAMYPVFTAFLIHLYNAGNADNFVSDVGRASLVKCITVIKKLSKLSLAATQLFKVLEKLLEVRKISIDIGNLSGDEGQNNSAHVEDMQGHHYQHQHHQQQQQSTNSERKAADGNHELSPSNPSRSDSETRAGSEDTPTLSVISGDWIHGLFSSMQAESSSQAMTSENLANSQEMMLPIDQLRSNLPSAQSSQQYPSFSRAPVSYDSTASFWFGNLPGDFPAPTPSTVPPPSYDSTLNIAACEPISMTPTTSDVGRMMFRNHPENPFWSVPSSIQLNDWTAYLSPPPSQFNMGQQQTPVSSSNWNIMH